MIFNTPWKTYDESEFDRHDTGEPAAPAIFIAQDRSCVLIETTDPNGASTIQIAEPHQITELWRRHRIAALLSVLRVVDRPKLVRINGTVSENT